MDQNLIQKLRFSCGDGTADYDLPLPLNNSLQIISEFFKQSGKNKLCLVFPSKEYAAHWLSIPTVLNLIHSDFEVFKSEITEAYRLFKPGDKLKLNGKAIVEWVGIKSNGVAFKTKKVGESSGAEITIKFADVIKLQKEKAVRQLSSLKTVKEVLPKRNITAIERLLRIDTYGNKTFIKNCICLVSKFRAFDNSIADILLNHEEMGEYFRPGKIDESGVVSDISPLLITNSLSNLVLYLTGSPPISKIIVDGVNLLTPRSDFSDIDRELRIQTVLITDLSEMEYFEEIKNHGFEFFNFSKEFILPRKNGIGTPFKNFNLKLNKYLAFKINRIICTNSNLEAISRLLHTLTKEDSDENLNLLRISLIQLTNTISRICYIPTETEVSQLEEKLSRIKLHFNKFKLWLGESCEPLEEIISKLVILIGDLSNNKTDKCLRFEEILQNRFDYIICPTDNEADILKYHIDSEVCKIISIGDVNDRIITEKPVKAILTGWPKSSNLNRILSSFLFSELTVLFYRFEDCYYFSLQRHNRKNIQNLYPTIKSTQVIPIEIDEKSKGFEDIFIDTEVKGTPLDGSLDIFEFELRLDNTQYSKYSGKGNLADSCKAKRIDFENNTFIYASESHKFLVINELIDSSKSKPNIHGRRVDYLHTGDVIAFINTDRDVLVELVEKMTKPHELAAIKRWTELWKSLLRDYYSSVEIDFKKVVDGLRKYNCKKHPLTIRNWLQDDNLIGPENDEDLISIAQLTKSNELYDNISTVRKAISQMVGWRMKASDLVREKIKSKLLEISQRGDITYSIEIPELGRVEILKVSEIQKDAKEIDKRFIHHLLVKEII
jgi:hypothetical protein